MRGSTREDYVTQNFEDTKLEKPLFQDGNTNQGLETEAGSLWIEGQPWYTLLKAYLRKETKAERGGSYIWIAQRRVHSLSSNIENSLGVQWWCRYEGHWGTLGKHLKTGTWRRNHRGRLLTRLLSGSCLASFLIQPRSTCLKMALSMEGLSHIN